MNIEASKFGHILVEVVFVIMKFCGSLGGLFYGLGTGFCEELKKLTLHNKNYR